MESLEDLKKQLEVAEEEYNRVFNLPIDGLSIEQYIKRLEAPGNKCQEISRKINMLKEPQFEPIPKYGDVMSLEDFISDCKSGMFIDYDGSGNYARGNEMSNITILPSDVKAGKIRKDFDKVVWFNK